MKIAETPAERAVWLAVDVAEQEANIVANSETMGGGELHDALLKLELYTENLRRAEAGETIGG